MNEEKNIPDEGLPKIRTMQTDLGTIRGEKNSPVPEIPIPSPKKDEPLPTITTMPKGIGAEPTTTEIPKNPIIEEPIVPLPPEEIKENLLSPKINALSRMPAPLPKETTTEAPVRAPQSLRTFSDDLSLALRKTQGSIISIAIQEEERRNQTKPEVKKRDSFLVVISVGLISMAIFAILFVVSGRELPFNKVEDVSTPSERLLLPITTDSVKAISLDGKTKETATTEVLNLANVIENGLAGIIFTKTFGESNRILSTTDFVSFFGFSIPGELERDFESSFLYAIDKSESVSPFFIFTADSFESAFSGMLEWEKNIPTDLYQFLDIKREELGDEIFIFEDSVIENKDVRILNLGSGKQIFYLVYPDGTIFIATDKALVGEITEKISIEKLK